MINGNSHPAESARAKIYKSLAECYYRPAADTASHVRALGRNLKSFCPPASEAADQMEAALLGYETDQDLTIDHARLFLGPFALLTPPYGSVYLDGNRQVMSASTLDAAARYQEVGLDLAPGFAGTPDHIAAELEFMYFLAFKEHEALSAGDPDRVRHFQGKQRAFMESHLAAWVPPFTLDIETQAQTLFYRNLARVTRIWVESEAENWRTESFGVAGQHRPD